MFKVKLIRWVNGEILMDDRLLSSIEVDYAHSIGHMLGSAFDSMQAQGFPVYSPEVATERLRPLLQAGELFWFVGPTWIGLVGQCEDWHSPTRTLAEEIVGPRFDTMDLEDYLNAMHSLATQIHATDFQVGMLANPRKQAMLRLLTSLGMEHTTSIVKRSI
ncbi:hypothetical protein [Pseudomonas phage Eisa9]|uniref:Uncharacterized protein n=1 Tax=Pseudomonas phage Eisa9 TaxID=2900148 RepID=A0AAE8YJ34_9CAUD|nr:hypothetical protein [Pseudomonas phage Eisa9]